MKLKDDTTITWLYFKEVGFEFGVDSQFGATGKEVRFYRSIPNILESKGNVYFADPLKRRAYFWSLVKACSKCFGTHEEWLRDHPI
jgi:hypothetical protein